ncbi:hypothetical protein V7152_15045 [Neobacillus drentensis]|uniref:hypothetical protein n=1 Tax=Neobacillus drentensis TaxID=220684 RepID=UPI002FFEDF44
MNKIISGNYIGHDLVVNYGKIWILNGENEVQINKDTIEKHEIVDSTSTTTSHTTTNTKGTSRKGTKSIAGRAIVGGVLLGPVGAVVGAGTAKNKTKSVAKGTTTETTTREFKILVTFNDGKQALLELDDYGYENLLIAVFSEPYETYNDILKANADALKVKQAAFKKKMIRFLKFVVCPIAYLILFVKLPVPIFILTVVGAGWLIYKVIKKTIKKVKNFKGNSSSV